MVILRTASGSVHPAVMRVAERLQSLRTSVMNCADSLRLCAPCSCELRNVSGSAHPYSDNIADSLRLCALSDHSRHLRNVSRVLHSRDEKLPTVSGPVHFLCIAPTTTAPSGSEHSTHDTSETSQAFCTPMMKLQRRRASPCAPVPSPSPPPRAPAAPLANALHGAVVRRARADDGYSDDDVSAGAGEDVGLPWDSDMGTAALG